jgi:hypothetical protein
MLAEATRNAEVKELKTPQSTRPCFLRNFECFLQKVSELLMMNLDFSAMSKSELRTYVITHPNNKIAFHAFVDRFTSEASPETFDIPNSNAEFAEVEILIQQKLEQLKAS